MTPSSQSHKLASVRAGENYVSLGSWFPYLYLIRVSLQLGKVLLSLTLWDSGPLRLYLLLPWKVPEECDHEDPANLHFRREGCQWGKEAWKPAWRASDMLGHGWLFSPLNLLSYAFKEGSMEISLSHSLLDLSRSASIHAAGRILSFCQAIALGASSWNPGP